MESSHIDTRGCTCPQPGKPVIAFSGNVMGNGPDELGGILIKAFVGAIGSMSPLPGALVFYNTGILLTVEGSTLITPLRELQERGVELLVCGTCLDYFGKKELLRAGTLSNMYTILETLGSAHHVIYP